MARSSGSMMWRKRASVRMSSVAGRFVDLNCRAKRVYQGFAWGEVGC
jgi:hypothetical protein